ELAMVLSVIEEFTNTMSEIIGTDGDVSVMVGFDPTKSDRVELDSIRLDRTELDMEESERTELDNTDSERTELNNPDSVRRLDNSGSGCLVMGKSGYGSTESGDTGEPAIGYPECRQTEMGKDYVGTQRRTETGKSCLRWDTYASNYSKTGEFGPMTSYGNLFRFGDPKWDQDFCRNPTLKERPWCFVDKPGITFEFCNIPLCPNYPRSARWTSWKNGIHAYPPFLRKQNILKRRPNNWGGEGGVEEKGPGRQRVQCWVG
ncbi:unnamed protein product, partial [Darwinula stevensoni]